MPKNHIGGLVVKASELRPDMIGRVISFAGPKDSYVTDELTSIVASHDNESILLGTRSSAPYDPMRFPNQMWPNGWSVPWGADVVVGNRAKTAESCGIKKADK